MVEERHWKCGGGGKPIGTLRSNNASATRTIGLISNRTTLHMHNALFVYFFCRICTTKT